MKKVLAVLLTIVFVFSMIPFSFAAATEKDPPKKRYTVLALETTRPIGFSWNGEPIYTASSALPYVKEAACRFLSELEASGDENYVALLVYFGTTICNEFTDQLDKVREQIETLQEMGTEIDLSRALYKSDDLFKTVDDPEAEKNLVLVTTGMANSGYTGEEGPFDETTPGSNWTVTYSNVPLYQYANGAIHEAEKLKNNGIRIYTIGIFQTMEGMPEQGKGVAWLFRQTVEYLASDEFSYPVDDTEQLEKTFEEVAQTINNDGVKPSVTFLLGDVDDNGKVESADARLALRASVRLEDYAERSAAFLAADVNRDNKIGSDDARLILRVSVKLESFA